MGPECSRDGARLCCCSKVQRWVCYQSMLSAEATPTSLAGLGWSEDHEQVGLQQSRQKDEVLSDNTTISCPATKVQACLHKVTLLNLGFYQGFATSCLGANALTKAHFFFCGWPTNYVSCRGGISNVDFLLHHLTDIILTLILKYKLTRFIFLKLMLLSP